MCATKEHHEVENYLIISEIRYIFKFSLLLIPCIYEDAYWFVAQR